jgi:hypothetical protein
MSNSSLPTDYSTTLDDLLTSTITASNATYPSITCIGGSYTTSTISNITLTSPSTSCYTIASGSGSSSIFWGSPAEWVDGFPSWDRVQKMCNEYPGLKIAFDNFKTVYLLVKDDYDTPEDKRIRP